MNFLTSLFKPKTRTVVAFTPEENDLFAMTILRAHEHCLAQERLKTTVADSMESLAVAETKEEMKTAVEPIAALMKEEEEWDSCAPMECGCCACGICHDAKREHCECPE